MLLNAFLLALSIKPLFTLARPNRAHEPHDRIKRDSAPIVNGLSTVTRTGTPSEVSVTQAVQ
jgi:hypothetical protein